MLDQEYALLAQCHSHGKTNFHAIVIVGTGIKHYTVCKATSITLFRKMRALARNARFHRAQWHMLAPLFMT